MDDLLWTITKLSGGLLGYDDVLWIATSVVCLLLLASARKLHASDAGSGAPRRPLALLWVVIGLSLAIGLPDWLGIPQVNDYSTPWHVLTLFWLLASVPTSFVLFRTLRGERKHPLLALLCAVTGLVLVWALIGATLRMNEHGVIAPAALLYAVPLLVGGVLLGWALAWGRRRYALYVAAWFTSMSTVGLFMYRMQMDTPMYRVGRLSGVPSFSRENAGSMVLVKEAIQAQVWISLTYFVVSLVLLMLPLLLSIPALRALSTRLAMARARRTTLHRAPGPEQGSTPLDDKYQVRGRA